MQYTYNYNALNAFLEKNHLEKKDILKALGTKDYATLNSWLEGKVPVHTTALLRICNFFQIPMETFFFDNDQPLSLRPTRAGQDEQQLPTGYVTGQPRQRGGGVVETIPTATELAQTGSSAMEQMMKDRVIRRARWREELMGEAKSMDNGQQTTDNGQQTTDNGQQTTDNGQQTNVPTPVDRGPLTDDHRDRGPLTDDLLRIQLEHVNEIRHIEADHAQKMIAIIQNGKEKEEQIRQEMKKSFDEERERLLQIIEKQNSELVRIHALSATMAGQKKQPTYGLLNDDTYPTDNVICDMSSTADAIK